MDEQLKKILAELKKLGASTAEVEKLRKIFSDSTISAKDLEKAIGAATTKVYQLEEASKFTNETFRDLSSILKQNLDDLQGKNSGLKDSLKFSRSLVSIAQKLQSEEEGISTLNEKELTSLVAKAKTQKSLLADALESISYKSEELKLNEQGNITGKDGQELAGAALDSHLKRLVLQKEISSLEADALRLKQSGLVAEEGFVKKIQYRLNLEKEFNKSMGLSGDIIKSAAGFMGKLGLDSKILGDATKESTEAMRKYAKANTEVEEGTGKILKTASKTKTALKGLGPLAKGFGKALVDPATIAASILKGFLAVNKAQVESIRLTGAAATAFQGMSLKVASTSEVIASSAAATRQLGIDANQLFGNELLTSMTYFQHELGLSAEATTRLGTISKLTGQTIESINTSISEGASEMNEFAKSGVPVGIVLQDVLSASDDITASLGNNPKAIAKAATAARGLGLDLNKVNSIADGLLDFSSSIEAELEAQLLTGKNINFNKARELALNNDLEGVAKELAKSGASAAEFANMNRVQQNALAKAMGMSRAELGKMVLTQEQSSELTAKQRADIAGVTVEQLKSEDVMHRLNRSLMMLGEAFAPMLEVLVPLVTALVKPISFFANIILSAFAGVQKLNEALGLTKKTGIGIVDWGKAFTAGLIKFAAGGTILLIGKSLKDAFSPSLTGGFFKNLKANFNPKNFGLKNLKEKIGGLFSKDGASKITEDAKGKFRDAKGRFAKNPLTKNPLTKPMDKGADMTNKMQKKTKGAAGAKGPGGFLKSLGDGLAAIGKKFGQVVKGALALGIAGVAIGGSFAIALKLVKDVDPIQMLAFSTSIGIFGGALALLGNMASQVIKGSVAMGILSIAAIGFAAAFSMLENVDTNKMIAFSIAVPLLGLAAAGLGLIAPFIFAGALAIGALGLSLIPLAGAFALLGAVNVEGILDQLKSFAAIAPSLLIAGAGMIALAGGAAVLGLASPMLLVAGGALAMLGMAAQIASNANIEGIASQLTQLAGIGPGLVAAGIGLFAISGGLTAFALAMAGASALGALTSIFGGGVMGDLQALAAMAEPLSQVGVSLTAIAAGLSGIALALSTLETAKIDELKGLVMTTALSAPMVAASGAITDLIAGITGQTQEGNSNTALEAKLDELIAAVKQGGDVFIDGNKAGNALMLASYKTA